MFASVWHGVKDVDVEAEVRPGGGGSPRQWAARLRKICFRSRDTVCFPCASHGANVAILAKAGCRRGCLVHGSLPMPILIPFGHPPAFLFSSRFPTSRFVSLSTVFPLSRSRSIPTPQVPRSRSQESSGEGHARCNCD